jgi:hypothetical protein
MKLKVGDKVVWFKRIPGGDYVYPVAGNVLGFTEKRVKIETDDDGEIGPALIIARTRNHPGSGPTLNDSIRMLGPTLWDTGPGIINLDPHYGSLG